LVEKAGHEIGFPKTYTFKVQQIILNTVKVVDGYTTK
jgi:hypothetical protein